MPVRMLALVVEVLDAEHGIELADGEGELERVEGNHAPEGLLDDDVGGVARRGEARQREEAREEHEAAPTAMCTSGRPRPC